MPKFTDYMPKKVYLTRYERRYERLFDMKKLAEALLKDKEECSRYILPEFKNLLIDICNKLENIPTINKNVYTSIEESVSWLIHK